MISSTSSEGALTKRRLLSLIARLYDVLGSCSPALIKPKMMLQRLWENELGWDHPVSRALRETWERWCGELPALRDHLIPRNYFRREIEGSSMLIHRFCNASDSAYAKAVYLRAVDQEGLVHVSLVMAKTKVAPMKGLTLPMLELRGAVFVAKLLSHTARILDLPNNQVYTWSGSNVVLSWLRSKPRRFKTFVSKQVSEILELAPPTCWQHVSGRTIHPIVPRGDYFHLS